MLCSEGRQRRIWTFEACVDRRLGKTPPARANLSDGRGDDR